MKAIHRKRLLNVAKALRESKDPFAFDMTLFGHDCGTPACALGTYGARRDLQRTLFLKRFRSRILGERVWIADSRGRSIGYDSPAVFGHFGISADDADELFSSSGCGGARSPVHAARYIERFVARKDREARP